MKIWSVRSVVKYFAVSLVVVALALMPHLASADLLSWTSHPPVVEESRDIASDSEWSDICAAKFNSIKMTVPIHGISGTPNTDCLMADGSNFALFYNTHFGLSIQFAGEQYARLISGIDCEHRPCLYLPSRDELVIIESHNTEGSGRLAIYKNFVSKLTLQKVLPLDQSYYAFDQAEPDMMISDFYPSEKYNGRVMSMQRSQNDKWLVVELVNSGLFRIDMDTMQMVKFADDSSSGWFMKWQPEYSITDDGQHIAVFGENTTDSVYDITSGCGITLSPSSSELELERRQQNPCPSQYIGNVSKDPINPNDLLIPRMKYAYQPQFSDDGGEITYYATSYTDPQLLKYVTLRAANYTGPTPLDYLALGDSYSSGEGDTERDTKGNKYYRSYTDTLGSKTTPRERCHVSTRSYPYKLAIGMELTPNSWNTVACSGATTWDVKGQGATSYTGQWNRLKTFNVGALKTEALNEFIPGRQKQIEFVKRYKPKVITLTMGGNDVGFGEKIEKCVLDPNTCNFAGSERKDMASEINNQYKNLKQLYEELYRASGNRAKIYVLGYPDFINGDANASCSLNIGALNKEERELIANSVTYLNNVIKQAARAAGVKYIDIEHSLDGHRLCDDGEKYVTGITDPFDWSNNRQESFHPNAKGNQAIAISVWNNTWNDALGQGESLVDYAICPTTNETICPDVSATKDSIIIPDYFKNVDSNKNVVNKQMTSPNQKKGSLITIALGQFTFGPSSLVNMTIHSDPINLGQYKAATDGSLETSVGIPEELSVGYHTITLTGETYSGEPVEYEQTVLVKGANSNDVDDDGILDTKDACLFVPASGIDQDEDGIDDTCDTQIDNYQVVQTTSSYFSESSSTVPIKNNPVLGSKLRHEKNDNSLMMFTLCTIVIITAAAVGFWQRDKIINYFKK